MLLSVSHFQGEREKNFSPDGNLFCGASRIAGFGEGTPQQVSREGQNRRIADFGTVVETCSVTAADCPCPGFSVYRANRAGLPARCVLSFSSVNMTPERGFAARWLRLFPFPLKIHFKGRQLPAGQEFSQIFFRFCNAGNEILATGGAENFSFHSPHHRVLKFAKRNGQFSLCFLLRTKIRNAKRRGKKIFLSLTTTIRTGQNGRERSRATKKQQIFFRLTAFTGRAGGGWYSVLKTHFILV